MSKFSKSLSLLNDRPILAEVINYFKDYSDAELTNLMQSLSSQKQCRRQLVWECKRTYHVKHIKITRNQKNRLARIEVRWGDHSAAWDHPTVKQNSAGPFIEVHFDPPVPKGTQVSVYLYFRLTAEEHRKRKAPEVLV